jgi:hypothetical protein
MAYETLEAATRKLVDAGRRAKPKRSTPIVRGRLQSKESLARAQTNRFFALTRRGFRKP